MHFYQLSARPEHFYKSHVHVYKRETHTSNTLDGSSGGCGADGGDAKGLSHLAECLHLGGGRGLVGVLREIVAKLIGVAGWQGAVRHFSSF